MGHRNYQFSKKVSAMSARKTLTVPSLWMMILLLLWPAVSPGQITTATISGRITDASGSPVPQCNVVATNEATGIVHSATTTEDGQYLLPLLPIAGSYSIEAERKDFQRFVQKNIVLRVNENVRVDVTLKVGETSQTVEVSATPAQIETRETSLGEVIEQRRMVELPLNGRNPIQLASLVAGVTQITAPTVYTWRGGSYLSVSGSRVNENDYLLDGVHYNGAYNNNGLNLPSPDALQEFRLITNTFSAEYGRNAGSVFNTVTKSGTNQLHGSLWEFLRNDKLNARNFFLNQPGSKVAKLRQNQYGFAVGGPAIKNRLFLFGSYQGLRIRQEALRNTTPPTAAERAGFFSTPINDPTTGLAIAPDAQGRYFINPNRFDPVTVKVMNQFMPVPGAGGLLQQLGSNPINGNQFLLKTDGIITSKNVLNFSFFLDRVWRNDPFFNSQFLNYAPLVATNRSKVFTVTDTHTFQPNLLSQLRLSYHGLPEKFDCANQTSLRDFGSTSFVPDGEANNPSFNVSGRFSMGTSGLCGLFESTQSRQGSETLTWIKGSHSFKMGADINRVRSIIYAWYLNEGSFTFNGQITGNPVADFLMGKAAQYQRQTFSGQDVVAWEAAGFFQDDWKISSRLTVNLGMRYQIQTPYVTNGPIKDGKAVFRPGQQSTIYPGAPAGLVFPGDTGVPRGLNRTDRNNWEPRVGLAWDPFGKGKSSVRMSYGVFHDLLIPDATAQGASNQPFVYREIFNAPSGGVSDPYRGFPNPWPYRAYESKNPPFITPVFVSSTVANLRNPVIQSWTLDLQHQVTGTFMVEGAYVGKVANGLQQTNQSNPARYIPGNGPDGRPLSTAANVDSRRIYAPLFGSVRDVMSTGKSSFHALELTARKRLGHGLSFTTVYTWSKALDTVSTYSVGGAFPQDPFCTTGCEKGRADFDIPHVFAGSWVYEIPTSATGGWQKMLTGGWELSGITRLTSGLPFNVNSGINNSLNGELKDRADQIGDPYAIDNGRSRNDRILKWFNTAAFAINPVGRVGNSARNVVRGPAQLNTDLSAMKNFPISERLGRVQFRAEFFNALNQVRLANPGNVVSSGANFGRITSAGDPRLIQFGLKYMF